MLKLDLLVEPGVFLALPAKDLDESVGFLLRVSGGLQAPALGDFGYGGGQMF